MAGFCRAHSEPGQPSSAHQGQSPTCRSGSAGHIPAKEAGDFHLSIRAPFFFGFSPIHHSGISHCCPSTCAVPSTTAFKHPPATAPGWHAKKQGLGSLRYPREYPVTSIYPQPSAFLPTSSLQSRISQSSAFVQSTRLVLQTESTEPAMDLYFSVCIWTPKSLLMEADVQPEPWDSK